MPYRKKDFSWPEIKCRKGKEAIVWWERKAHYLGRWNGTYPIPTDIRKKHARLCEHLEERFHAKQADVPEPEPEKACVIDQAVDLYLHFLAEDEDGDRRPDGSLSTHYERACTHLRPLLALYGDTDVATFSAKNLKLIRKAVRKDAPTWWKSLPRYEERTASGGLRYRAPKQWSISYTTTMLQNVIGLFAWLEAEEWAPRGTVQHLQSVKPPRHRDHYEAPTVDHQTVETTLEYTSPPVAAMIRLQQLTAMRPGELCQMRPCDIDFRREVWVYSPASHKNLWRGHNRLVPLGQAAQKVLADFLDRPDDEYLFKPQEAVDYWHGQRASHPGRPATRKPPSRRRAAHYTQYTYRQAIQYAVDKANKAGEDIPAWRPYALRHTRITEIQATHGWDDAQAVAGHETQSTTRKYAHKRHQRALRIAAETQRVDDEDVA